MRCFTICLFIICLIGGPALAQTDGRTGLWWDPAKSGQGVSLFQQGDQLFVTIYSYDAAGAPAWYLLLGSLQDDALGGQLYVYTGAPFGPDYDPDISEQRVAGSATLIFEDARNARLTLTIDGVEDTLRLSRFGFGALDPTGFYRGGLLALSGSCNDVDRDGSFTLSMQDGLLAITTDALPGGQCEMIGPVSQAGDRLVYVAAIDCADEPLRNGTVDQALIRVTDTSFSAEARLSFPNLNNCSGQYRFGGIRK